MFAFKLRPLLFSEFTLSRNRRYSLQKNSSLTSCKTSFKTSTSRFICFNSQCSFDPKPKLIPILSQNEIRRCVGVQPPRKGVKRPLTWKKVFIIAIVGGIVTAYIIFLRNEKIRRREAQRIRVIGKAKVGGSFDLVDQFNQKVKSEDYLGQWLLIYFGFTHCPDICPDEIEKMVKVVDILDEKNPNDSVKPIFITVDPERDTPSVVGQYLKEFSEKIVGLTGTSEQIGKVCKAYRVYYSAGPKDSDNDYIVDHTIIMHLVGPDGKFVDYFPQFKTPEDIAMHIQLLKLKYYNNEDKGLLATFKSFL